MEGGLLGRVLLLLGLTGRADELTCIVALRDGVERLAWSDLREEDTLSE